MALRQSPIRRQSHTLSRLSAADIKTSKLRLVDQTANRTPVLKHSLFKPRNNRLSFNVQVRRRSYDNDNGSSTNKSESSPLLAVTSKLWKMYRVSPLHGFKNNVSSLKTYGRYLRHYLTTERMDVKRDFRYDVKFTVLNGLKCTDHDTDALQIEVFALSEGSSEVVKPVVLYLGILLSWGGSIETVSKHSTYLPLLLCISSVLTTQSVHGILSKLFDCFVHPLEISQADLMWLSVIANNRISRRSTTKRKVEFHYKCSQVSAGSMVIELSPNFVQDLWGKIHDARMEQIVDDEVFRFHQILGEQLVIVHKIKHTQMQLCQFVMPNMSMTLGGQLRVRSIQAAEHVLFYLHSLSLIIEGPTPGLSVPSI